MINHSTIKSNMNKLLMNISITQIKIEDHIISSDNIFTSGFSMNKTYTSIHRGE